jgi:MFS family permease
MQPSEWGDHPLSRDRNLWIVYAISLVAILGVASVTPAFPSLAIALEIPRENLGLLVTTFTFPSVVLSPVFGFLADQYGRKKVIVPSLLLFGIAGTACTFVRDFNLLLGLRFVQGIGAAALLSLSITLIGDLYTGDRRTTAMGYTASVSSVGTASYPTIGGALASLAWFYPFALPIVALPIAALVALRLKNPEPKGRLNLRTYLRNAGKSLRNRQVVGLFLASTANFILLYGAYVTYLPVLLADRFQADPFTIGLVMSSISAAIVVASSQLGNLAARFSTRTLIQVGYGLFAVALAIVPFVYNIWLLLLPTTIFGIGLGISFPSIQTLLTELAPRDYLATVVSVNGTFFGLGQTLGPLLMGIMFGWTNVTTVENPDLAQYGGVFFTSAAIALLTLVVFRYCTCQRSQPG